MKKTLTGLDFKIQEMAGRIRELREISGFSAQTMALKTGTSEEEYLRCEAGQSDLNSAFLCRCAKQEKYARQLNDIMGSEREALRKVPSAVASPLMAEIKLSLLS